MNKIGLLLTFFFLIQTILYAQDWEPVSSLPNAFNQTHHSFGFALDGKGYVVTGSSPTGARSDFYQYDASSDTWTRLPDFPGSPRSFAIGDTWDGKAYFGFGADEFGTYLRDFWVFDPVDTSWTELATCSCLRRTHPTLVAHNGKVFVGLGGGEASNLNDWWEYDIATDTWAQKPDFPSAPRHHPFQFGIDEYIYTGFGHGNGFISDRWYRYDPVAEIWDEMSTLPAEGRVAGTQFSYNGKGYVLSGDGDDHRSMETGEFWVYDPQVDEWSELPPHPSTSRWAPASFIIDDEVYIINGQTEIGSDYIFETSIYKFDLAGNVSVDDVNGDETAITAFPNPFTEHLNVKLNEAYSDEKSRLRIFDMQGRLLYQSQEISDVMNFAQLPKGLLQLEVSNEAGLFYKTVVKM